jgi:hypothetical protein
MERWSVKMTSVQHPHLLLLLRVTQPVTFVTDDPFPALCIVGVAGMYQVAGYCTGACHTTAHVTTVCRQCRRQLLASQVAALTGQTAS